MADNYINTSVVVNFSKLKVDHSQAIRPAMLSNARNTVIEYMGLAHNTKNVALTKAIGVDCCKKEASAVIYAASCEIHRTHESTGAPFEVKKKKKTPQTKKRIAHGRPPKSLRIHYNCIKCKSYLPLSVLLAFELDLAPPESECEAVQLVMANWASDLPTVDAVAPLNNQRPRSAGISSKRKAKLVNHFSCHKYTSTLALGYMVADFLGIEAPGTKECAIRTINRHWKAVTSRSSRSAPYKKSKSSIDFYKSNEWRELRYIALRNSNASCQCCGATPADGEQIHVDHIKPRSKYPELALDLDNLQLLCGSCNIGKSNYYNDDWRGLTLSD